MEADMKWYVIHTYSGYENKVMQTLEQKVKSMGLENVINRILIPMEDEIDIKDGKKRTVKRKVFLATFSSKWKSMTVPGMSSAIHRGYRFCRLGNQAYPAGTERSRKDSEDPGHRKRTENAYLCRSWRRSAHYRRSFENCMAVVTEINEEKGTVKGLVNMFGRETPVEVDYSQIEKGLE